MLRTAHRVAAPRRPAASVDDASPESGFTLVEVLVAVIIMGLSFAVVLTGIFTAIGITRNNRDLSEADRLARGLAEQLKEGDVGSTYEYRPCAIPNDAAGPASRKYPTYTPPEPHEDWRVVITKVEYRSSTNPTAWTSTCTLTGSGPTADDGGAQRITITARTTATRRGEVDQTIVVVKRDTRGDGS